MADHRLDVSGYACPIPILKARKSLNAIPAGATLEVLATDPAAPADFVAFCKATGHALLDNVAIDGGFRFVIRKGA